MFSEKTKAAPERIHTTDLDARSFLLEVILDDSEKTVRFGLKERARRRSEDANVHDEPLESSHWTGGALWIQTRPVPTGNLMNLHDSGQRNCEDVPKRTT